MRDNIINLFHCKGKNFGDAVNPILVERVFGIAYKSVPKTEAELIAVGSIMQRFTAENLVSSVQKMFYPFLHVWSSGFIADEEYKYFKRNIDIYAVRGRLTKQKCEKILGKELDIPLGDGGLLLSELLDRKVPKKYELGIIPHVADFKNPIFEKIKGAVNNSVIIDLSQEPMKVLKKIAACNCVISTAMHGLIAADSLGIPNKWIEVSDQIDGAGFKFRDYYSAFGLDGMAAKYLTPEESFYERDLKDVYDDYKIKMSDVEEIKKKLYNAFPFKP